MGRPDLEGIASEIRAELDDKHRVREMALSNSRTIIRRCANSIRALHRGEDERADALIAEAGDLLHETVGGLDDHPDIMFAGFVTDAAKEFAEASLFRALRRGEVLPTPQDLGVWAAPFAHGLGEAVGEQRRRMLDLLRTGDLEAAEQTLESMDAIIELLADLDYPDGMTGGLRRTTDVTRAIIERSRADLTTTAIQERLRRELADRA